MKLYFENIKLGGGMELPYDNNYCIFIKNNITTIKKVNSKKDFKDCEYTYGTFIDVSDSIEDAKIKVSQFSGPAKDNKLNILNEEDDLSKSKKRINENIFYDRDSGIDSDPQLELYNDMIKFAHYLQSEFGHTRQESIQILKDTLDDAIKAI